MLRQILLGLDDTPSSILAQRLAISLARVHGSGVTALTVVDAAHIAPAEGVPMGGDSYKQHKDLVLVGRAREQLVDLARRFADDCHAAQLNCEARVQEGDAIDALAAASDVHDLIVLGRDVAFHASRGSAVTDIVERLLRRNPRPIVVVPEQAPRTDRILVAYDGSIPAMRALQMFALLGIAGAREVTVVTIHSQRTVAEETCGRAITHLRNHAIHAKPRVVDVGAAPADALLEVAAEIDAGLIVMGTFGHRGWREFLLGSATDKLLVAAKAPLFLHH